MIIDDNPMALKIIYQVLLGFGVGCLIRCESASEAQKVVTTTPIDFIVTDGHMPEMDGYEFVQWLRHQTTCENRFVPILMVCSETRLSHVYRSRDVGANFVIAKPISPKVLLDRLFWLSKDKRDFIEADTFVGPDRRFRRQGPPAGSPGRRHDDQLVETASTAVVEADASINHVIAD